MNMELKYALERKEQDFMREFEGWNRIRCTPFMWTDNYERSKHDKLIEARKPKHPLVAMLEAGILSVDEDKAIEFLETYHPSPKEVNLEDTPEDKAMLEEASRMTAERMEQNRSLKVWSKASQPKCMEAKIVMSTNDF